MNWTQECLCPYCWNPQDSDYWEAGITATHKCEHYGTLFIIRTKNVVVFAAEKFGAKNDNNTTNET